MNRNKRRAPSRAFALAPALALAWLVSLVTAPAAVGGVEKYPTINYKDAGEHMDEIVWIEGTVLRTEDSAEGVYLVFSANEKYVRLLVPKASLANFQGSLQHTYTGKKVKAVGKVAKYGYKLIVGVNEPKRIRILDKDAT
jgi:hypothetical protein